MDPVDVCYSNNKSGTYVQFRMRVHTNDLSELNSYSKFLMNSVEKDFKSLFDTYGMAFTTESCYVVPDKDGKLYAVICIQGETTPELEDTLRRIGVERRGFLEEDK